MQQPKFSQAASFTIPNASGGTHRNMVPYKDNDDIRTLVRRAAVLPLLLPDTVKYVWFHALEDIYDTDINIPTLPLTSYVTSYWIVGNRD
ncbi:LOW QUALITY PROTEIN: hypothetical protein KUTeg_005166, partial [Tegillarca granosa]